MFPHLAHFSAMIAQLGKGFRKLGYVCGIAGYRAAALDTTFPFSIFLGRLWAVANKLLQHPSS